MELWDGNLSFHYLEGLDRVKRMLRPALRDNSVPPTAGITCPQAASECGRFPLP